MRTNRRATRHTAVDLINSPSSYIVFKIELTQQIPALKMCQIVKRLPDWLCIEEKEKKDLASSNPCHKQHHHHSHQFPYDARVNIAILVQPVVPVNKKTKN